MLYVFKRDEIWRDVKFRKWNINVYLNRFFFNILVQLLIHILKIRRMISSPYTLSNIIFIFFFLLHTPI